MTLSLILGLLAAYLLGSIPTGIIISKIAGAQDIRSQGSGNIGAANVTRMLGIKLGILTLLGDAAKGFFPTWFGLSALHSTGTACMLGGAAFLGHLYPVFLHFRGGKGVATGFGVLLCLEPVLMLVAFALFAGVVAVSKYVSVGSLVCAVLIPVCCALISSHCSVIALSFFIGILVVIRHKMNIVRLLQGCEHKISFHLLARSRT
ncbi:MAG: glycerol-3-phosphate 1-O-acyltransferase PlsY [Desulfobacterota bacterium]|nr:glycerol-3-phosphate 1-O-acyltransferase PlsY [Thermodesulfobacteriota bacterium]